MVLVDTSVWIRFLANQPPYAAELDLVLDRGEATGHDLIEGELLIGDSGERRELLNGYAFLHRVPTVSHDDVLTFVRARKLNGRGIGWVDVHLLASALLANVRVWTADERLARLARELGVEYVSKSSGDER